MNYLIVKLGATGDVVRTTPLLRSLDGHFTWVTAAKNTVFLEGIDKRLRCFAWEERQRAADRSYDLVINLEDTSEAALFVSTLKGARLFGAYADADGTLRYTDDSQSWFDLSLISRHGKQQADTLKLRNRRTYQDLIFEGLGLRFTGQKYLLPPPAGTGLVGDVAIASEAGPVWPMKNWACYDELKRALESKGLRVNVLGRRDSLLEHLGDVAGHRCLVGGDSLPMHLALGTGTRCVTLFNCTSPWEIYDYGIQEKIISPLIEEFFYQRYFDARATTAIALKPVLDAVMKQIEKTREVSNREIPMAR